MFLSFSRTKHKFYIAFVIIQPPYSLSPSLLTGRRNMDFFLENQSNVFSDHKFHINGHRFHEYNPLPTTTTTAYVTVYSCS